jgi:hypothetical protein
MGIAALLQQASIDVQSTSIFTKSRWLAPGEGPQTAYQGGVGLLTGVSPPLFVAGSFSDGGRQEKLLVHTLQMRDIYEMHEVSFPQSFSIASANASWAERHRFSSLCQIESRLE